MTAAITDVAPRLSKLLALLSSEHDGEVVAAARAMGRTLSNAGLGWHDLVAAIGGPAKVERVVGWSRMSRPDRLRTLNRLLTHDGLSAWERAFCQRIYAAIHLWPNSAQSRKQAAILDGLIWKVMR